MVRQITVNIPKAHKYIKSIKSLSVFLGMSPSTLEKWAIEGKIRRTKNGYWSTKAVMDYALRLNQERLQAGDSAGMEMETAVDALGEGEASAREIRTKDEAELRYKAARALDAELDLEIKRGNVISRDEVEQQMVAKVMTLKRSLLSMGRELAQSLVGLDDPHEVQEVIDRAVEYRIRVFASQTEEKDA